MRSRMFETISDKETKCLSCHEPLTEILPQVPPNTGNCINCGNFVIFGGSPKRIISQAIKEEKFKFQPEFNLKRVLEVQCKPIQELGYDTITHKYDPEAKYLKFR